MIRLSDYDYELPDERIAQEPIHPRDASRLLVVPRNGDPITHRIFRELPELLRPDDLLVINETRVSAVRLFGVRDGHTGEVEALLLRPALEAGQDCYEALVRPGKKIRDGERLIFEEAGVAAEVKSRVEATGGRILSLTALDETSDVSMLLDAHGRVPLPPYITAPLADKGRYQTVYAKTPGSAAAPTAGLHFTPELLQMVQDYGIKITNVCLDVGLGTFRPVRVENVLEHEMHAETFTVSPATAEAVNACTGRVIAVGTTSLRALESAVVPDKTSGKRVAPLSGETRLFVYPGYTFRAVDGLITNFHQPHSTLLLLVGAFVGQSRLREAYQTALTEGYRFLSFGDAMMVL